MKVIDHMTKLKEENLHFKITNKNLKVENLYLRKVQKALNEALIRA